MAVPGSGDLISLLRFTHHAVRCTSTDRRECINESFSDVTERERKKKITERNIRVEVLAAPGANSFWPTL